MRVEELCNTSSKRTTGKIYTSYGVRCKNDQQVEKSGSSHVLKVFYQELEFRSLLKEKRLDNMEKDVHREHSCNCGTGPDINTFVSEGRPFPECETYGRCRNLQPSYS